MQLIQRFRREFSAPRSKVTLVATAMPIFEGSIRTALDLYGLTGETQYAQDAFQISEASRAFSLMEIRRKQAARETGLVPKFASDMETRLQRDLAFYRSKVLREEAKGQKGNALKIANWNARLFEIENKREKLAEWLDEYFPRFQKYMEEIEPVDNETFSESTLKEDQALIEYFFGASELFIFALSPQGLQTYRYPSTPNFRLQIQTLVRSLSDLQFIADSARQCYSDFTRSAYSLYETLLKPVLSNLPEMPQELVIVSDGPLNRIPFDILLTSPATGNSIDYLSLSYLLHQSSVRYSYSASFLHDLSQQAATSSSLNCLAMAPNYSGTVSKQGTFSALRNSHTPLPGAQKEVYELAHSGMPGT
ncbi:MAG: CHAT domain-containing protein, partial [Bacteroidota bacterium]